MIFSTGHKWFSNRRLGVIEEEDLQELLEQCEHDSTLRPMPIKTDHKIHDELPKCIDLILRFLNLICCCFR